MCHLCRKLEALEGLDSKVIEPISALLSQLHKRIEPELGDFWLQRHEQTVRLRRLLAKLHNAVPITRLRDMLDSVDRELYHIRKNMSDHPPQLSIGTLDTLNESIAPSSSASCQVVKHRLRKVEQERHGSLRVHRRPKDLSESQRVGLKDIAEGSHLPELPGSDINPSPARVQQSIRTVEAWFRGCEEAEAEERRQTGQLVHSAVVASGSIGRSYTVRFSHQDTPEVL
jgi:hypothetical protein